MQMAHGLFSLQISIFSFALDGFCQTAEKVAVSILSFIGFLCHFLVLTLLWGAPSGTTAEKVAISMLFPLRESLAKGTKPSFFRPLPRFPAAIFKIFLCVGRLLLKCWKSCNFHAFPTAAKHHFYDFHCAQTQFLSSIAKVSCGIWACHYIQTDGTWLMFSAIFKMFLCVGRLLPKLLKKLQFPSFPTAAKHHFYDLIAPKSNFFRPWPRFPAEFEHDTTYKQMAHGLFSLQFSKVFLCFGRLLLKCWKSCNFHAFPTAAKASLLWSRCAQTQFLSSIAKVSCGIWAWHYIQTDGTWLIFSAMFKVFLCFGRLLPFPSFQWVSLQFSWFSFALGGFCQKCWKSCNFQVSFGFWACH